MASKGGREKDMEGHLLSEKEKKKKEEQSVSPSAGGTGSGGSVEAWWKDAGSKKNEKQSSKDKLLSSDYQVYQAYNYLKAWKLMKGMRL